MRIIKWINLQSPNLDKPELRDCLPASAMCAGIVAAPRAWRWQAGELRNSGLELCRFLVPEFLNLLIRIDSYRQEFSAGRNTNFGPKGSRKNNLAELALRFGSDLADPIEQNHRNSWLFRGFCE